MKRARETRGRRGTRGTGEHAEHEEREEHGWKTVDGIGKKREKKRKELLEKQSSAQTFWHVTLSNPFKALGNIERGKFAEVIMSPSPSVESTPSERRSDKAQGMELRLPLYARMGNRDEEPKKEV